MKVHVLKTWPSQYEAVQDGRKGFEIRKNDRDFKEGDVIVLRKFMPGAAVGTGEYMGPSLGPFLVGYVETGDCIPEGWCGFQLVKLGRVRDEDWRP